jgi:hypothetical protein
MKTYFTVAVRDCKVWTPQWGSYSRAECEQEVLDSWTGCYHRADIRIIRTGDEQRCINAGIAKLNGAA